MQEQFVKLKSQMATTLAATPSPQNTAVYRKQMEQVQNLRNGYKDLNGDYVHGFNEMAMATGRFHVETVKTLGASQLLSKSIKDQKLTFGQLFTELRKPNMGGLQEVWREQTALRQAMSMQWSGSQLGKNSMDIYMPKGLGGDLDNARMKYGVINDAIRAAATQTVNWGKNMQWAGRQITVGIGVPIAMIAAGMGKLALAADQQLVRITKVYDAQSQNIADADQRAIATQNELANVRTRSMTLGISMAKQYGASLGDTLGLEADLAATGKTGNELMSQTAQVTRIATLGELDRQKALDMSITLGTVFNQNAEEMGKSFDYINAIENSTSLSTQDFAEALPRAGSALHGLGMNLQEIGVLLVAMKAGGVDAAEGANALKSATSRLVKPTQQAKDLMWGYGINLEAIVNGAGGDLLQVLEKLGKQMQNLTPVQKQQAMATIFGTFQFNKLNAVMSQLSDTTAGYGDQQSQVARAFQTMAAGSDSWAQTAAQEQAQMANSASGQFKRAIETLKAEMAQMGQAFLGPITAIVGGLSGIVHWISNLPGIVKVGVTALATFGLLAGPLIMMVGLFGNLIGNVMKFTGWIANLGLRFKMMTKEERANEIMQRRAASAFDSEASSVSKLTIELQNMIATMEKQYALQAEINGQATKTVAANEQIAASEAEVAAAATGATPVGGMGKRKNSGSRNSTQGKQTTAANQAAAREAAAARQAEAAALANGAGSAGKIEENAAKTKVSMGKVAGYMGAFAIGALSLKGMTDTSAGLATNLMNAAMFIGVLGGTGVFQGMSKLAGLAAGGLKKGTEAVAKGWHAAGDGVRYAYAQGKYFEGSVNGIKGGLKSVSAGIKSLGSSMLSFFGPGGLVIAGLAVAAAAFLAIKSYMEGMESRQAKINKSTSDWADLLGYTEKTYGNFAAAQGKQQAQSPYQARRKEVEDLTSKNEDLVNSLKDAAKASDNFASVYSLAVGEALKVKMSGGNAAQAKEAFAVALQASGISEQKLKELSLKFDNVKLDDPAAVADLVQSQIQDAINTAEGHLDLSGFGDAINNFWNGDELGQAAKDAGQRAGAQLGLGLANAASAGDQQKLVQGTKDRLNVLFAKQFTDYANDPDLKDAIKTLGLKSMSDFEEATANLPDKIAHSTGDVKKAYEKIYNSGYNGKAQEQYKEMMESVMKSVQVQLGLTDDDMKKLRDSGYSTAVMMQVVGDKTDIASRGIGDVGAAANTATSFMDGFNNALQQSTEIDLTADQVVGGMKDAFQQAQGYALQAASAIMQKQQQAEQDAIQKRGDKKSKALDAQSKATDKYYEEQSKALDKQLKKEKDAWDKGFTDQEDALEANIEATKNAAQDKIDAINEEIDALQKADDERQKLFDREKKRIERMAALQNNNIDFNSALNSGNLDQAAKLYNSNQATVSQWSNDDQQSAMDDASKKKQDALSGKIKQIENERDAQVKAYQDQEDALKKLHDAQQDAFDAAQQQRKDDLEAAKQAAKDKLDAQKEALSQGTQAALKANQDTWQDKQVKLDMEINAIKASVPRTVAEYNTQVAQIEAAYKKYGVDLQSYGDQWNGTIGAGLTWAIAASSNSIQNDIKWAQIGQYISDQIANGTGISVSDLKSFLETGKWPTNGSTKNNGKVEMAASPYSDVITYYNSQVKARHSGGFVGNPGFSSADRVGVPRSASKYPSEHMAILKKGEFVVNAQAASANAGLLAEINNKKRNPFGETGPGGWVTGNFPTISRHAGGAVGDGSAGAQAALSIGGFGFMFSKLVQAAVEQTAVSHWLGTDGSDPSGGPGYTGTMAPQSIAKTMQFARLQQGKPYIWGGADPAGADCSGFMSEIYNMLTGHQVKGKPFPYGRDFATADFAGGKEIAGFKRGGGPANAFRIGVDPGSHMAGTLFGVNVESGSGHGPMVGGKALGADDKSFKFRYYLPMADIPQLYTGGTVKYDNTLANLHKDETVLTAPLTKAFEDNVLASGNGNEYNVNVNFHGPVNSEIDVEKAVKKAIAKADAEKAAKKRRVN